MFELVALDVDGTLLDDQHRLHPTTRDAILEAQQRGARICLATGKLLASVRPLLSELGLHGAQIVCNGAALMDGDSGCVVSAWPLEFDLLSAALATICNIAPDQATAWYSTDAIFTDAPVGPLDDILASYHEPSVRHVSALDGALPPALKLLLTGDPDHLRQLRDHLTAALGGQATVMRTTADFVEIVSPEVSKGRALTALAAQLGINRDSIVAIGDGENDLSLFDASGMGIAMGNAMPALLRRADAVTATANELGVVHALTALGMSSRGDGDKLRRLPPSDHD
ncbi:MAG TPA: Cof-type HAD-IIB family hydrolase [Ktedonobacterales bacterium]